MKMVLYFPLTDNSRLAIHIMDDHFSILRELKTPDLNNNEHWAGALLNGYIRFPIAELNPFLEQMPRIEKLLVLK